MSFSSVSAEPTPAGSLGGGFYQQVRSLFCPEPPALGVLPLHEGFVCERMAGGATVGGSDAGAEDLLVADMGWRVGVHGEGINEVDDSLQFQLS